MNVFKGDTSDSLPSLYITTIFSENQLGDFIAEIDEDVESHESINKLLKEIFQKIGDSLTIVCEMCYVDRAYRDTYYTYFSAKYVRVERDCKRLFLFSGYFDREVFFCYDDKIERILQENFIGMCILKPLAQGKIGRTLLDPKKLNIPAYIRTTDFQFFVLGHTLTVDAFPYSSQDGEMMTCAETTTWNILEYYGTRYSAHRTVLPSEMLHSEDSFSCERNLPSSGLTAVGISYLLKTFGFSPRIYTKEYIKDDSEFNEKEYKYFRRMFHYYVESGLPLAVCVHIPKMNGHAVVCIGHGKRKTLLSNKIDSNFLKLNDYPCVNSANYYDDYVLMDDNQNPYRVEDFDEFTLYRELKAYVDGFIVPLPKRVFLEAKDAETIARGILMDPSLGLLNWGKCLQTEVTTSNPLVFRLFLTSTRKYRCVRLKSSGNDYDARMFYGGYPLPRFVWIAEIASLESYKNGLINGEIVIDATVANDNVSDGIIMLRYGCIWINRPSGKDIWIVSEGKNCRCPYPMYINNLRYCGRNA